MMKQSAILCIPGLISSAFAFVPQSTISRAPNSWSTRSTTSAPGVTSQSCTRNSPVCMSSAQSEVYGLDLSKPKAQPTADDYLYEQQGVPDTPMTRRFGHLRSQKVKTVSQTVSEFYENYKNLIFPQFRVLVTEYLQSTHLTVYDARFKYDPFFGAGLYSSFTRFMRSYPRAEEVDMIFDGIVQALGQGLDAHKMRDDLKSLKEWAAGKSEEDVMSAMMSDDKSDIVTEGFYIARTGLGPFGEGWETKGEDVDWFLYNRMWAVGVFTLIEGIGLEPNDELLERWFDKMGTPSQGITKDLNLYLEQVAKLEASEQLWKEVEIREKKRLAERLEEKAQDAIRQAELAEKDAREEREERERIANAKEGDVLPNDLPRD